MLIKLQCCFSESVALLNSPTSVDWPQHSPAVIELKYLCAFLIELLESLLSCLFIVVYPWRSLRPFKDSLEHDWLGDSQVEYICEVRNYPTVLVPCLHIRDVSRKPIYQEPSMKPNGLHLMSEKPACDVGVYNFALCHHFFDFFRQVWVRRGFLAQQVSCTEMCKLIVFSQ